MSEWREIGTVTILRDRVYPLDDATSDDLLSTSVVVEPGVYPVYRRDDVVQWLMTGHINDRHHKIGDGMFAIGGGDQPTGLPVQFPSRAMAIEEFRDFLDDPATKDCLRFRLWRIVGQPGKWCPVDPSPDPDKGRILRTQMRVDGRDVVAARFLSRIEVPAAIESGEMLFTAHRASCSARRPRNPRPRQIALDLPTARHRERGRR